MISWSLIFFLVLKAFLRHCENSDCVSVVIRGAGISGCVQQKVVDFSVGAFLAFDSQKIHVTAAVFFPPVPVKCFPLEASILRASSGFLEWVYFKVCLTIFAVSSCFPVFKSVLKDEIRGPTASGLAAQHSKLLTSTGLLYQANSGVNLCLILSLLDWI